MTTSERDARRLFEGPPLVIELEHQRALELRFRMSRFRAWVVGVEGIELHDEDLDALDEVHMLLGGGVRR